MKHTEMGTSTRGRTGAVGPLPKCGRRGLDTQTPIRSPRHGNHRTLALQVSGNSAWLPDFPGLCCILVSLACLAHAPRAWSRQAGGTGPWSLTLVLLAAVAGAYRILTLPGYLHDPHLITVSLAELLIVAGAVVLVAPDAARAQTPTPAPPPYPRAMTA